MTPSAAARTFRDCIVLHGESLQPRWCHRLVVADGIIQEMALGQPVQRPPGPCHVIMPGMVNAHTHVGDSFLADGATGLSLEEGFFRPNGFKYRELQKIGESDHISAMRDTLCFMKRSGTIAHVDFREQGLSGARRLRQASELAGVQSIILSQFNESPFDQSALEKNRAPLPAAAAAGLQDLLTVADGFSESTMNDLTDAAWQQVRQITDAAGKARAVHCLENAGYRDVSLARTGRGDLPRALDQLQPDCVVHLTVAREEEILLLAKAGIPAVINPRANAVLGLPLPPVAALLKAGVPLLLGTDNGMLNPPNLFAELDFTYRLARSQFGNASDPDPARILRMVTSNFAATRWGTLFPGHLASGLPAHLVVLDFSRPPLCHSAHVLASIVSRITPEDVLLTMRQGVVIHCAPPPAFP